MSVYSDSSDEMHNNDLTSDVTERLVNGEYDSPAHTDLAAIVSEMRGLASGVPTPKLGTALSEFVGVGLVINEIPVGTPDAEVDLRSQEGGEIEVPTRRNSVFAQIAALTGTFGSKIAIGGVIAAASVTGAHATGVVDVPGLPETAAEVDTIDTELDGNVELAELPEALSFVDEEQHEDEREIAEEKAAAKEKAVAEAEERVEEKKIKAEEEAVAEAEERAEKEAAKKAEHEAKEEAERKAAAEAEAKKKATQKKIDELEEQVHRDKEAVRAAATVKISAGEQEHEELEVAFELALDAINEQFEGYIADINAQVEASDDEGSIAELEAYREVKFSLWEDALNEKEIYYGTKFAAIGAELEEIELARDAEIERLLKAFREAVEIGKGQ
ncbi:MAG: chemotaxis protein histidine kinase CheA [Verrucomicrobiales bacterium]|jgi:chemotaxis protein histidine kinase CheA